MIQWFAGAFLGLSFTLSAGVAAQADVSSSSATEAVSGIKLAIVEGSPECLLRWENAGESEEIGLQVPSPCQLHRGPGGEVRVKTSGGKQYVLIESASRQAGAAQDCITFVRALVIEASAVRASPHTARVAACPPFQWDEKMFTALFEK
jgi:hypothetical protein